MFGPLVESVLPTPHINGFGIIPKPHQPGKYRLIVDLPHPRGASVNDGIERELCSGESGRSPGSWSTDGKV